MCGRFVASRPIDDVAQLFEVDDVDVPDELAAPRWNIAPQAGVLAVRARRPKPEPDAPPGAEPALRRGLTDFRWGLVPSWAKDLGVGAKAINARAETLVDKPAFRTALAKRRCIVPADAFYEWRRSDGGARGGRGGREPWCFSSPDGAVLAFAGLYEVWRPSDPEDRDQGPGWHDDWLLTCSIITTRASDVVAPIHNRMPVMLEPADWAAWLDPGGDVADLTGLLRPAPDGALDAHPVSRAVNDARVEGPELVEPVALTEEPTMFS